MLNTTDELNEIRRQAAALLTDGRVRLVLGLRAGEEGIEPCFFSKPEELAELTLEPKWPIAKAAWRAVRELPEGEALAVVCRGCDARALAELEKMAQFRPDSLRVLATSCSQEQARACLCETPYPPGGAPVAGVDYLDDDKTRGLVRSLDRLEIWRAHFQRCIKCYGCRNACPICVCPSCKLEEDAYVTQGFAPPEPFVYHLIRAMHLADRCVGCGACQESCPSGLPLLALHLHLRRTLKERYAFESGTSELSPLLTAGKQEGPLGAPAPSWEDTRHHSTGGIGVGHGR